MGDTLVLSSSYEPMYQTGWQRAMILWAKGLVEVVEEYEDRFIRSVTFEIKMPSVIRFLKAVKGRKRAIKFSRENVYTRDKGKCQYCLKTVPRQESTFDHIVPRAQGGKTTWENVVICCIPCNQRKGSKTPEQARMKLHSTPVKPKSLPDTFRVTLTFHKDMPDSWRSYLRDIHYWNGELDNDNAK